MIKIAGKWIETFPLADCNLSQLYKKIYSIPTDIRACPLCKGKLIKNYIYAIQVSQKECIRVSGCACAKCYTFFSTENDLLKDVEHHIHKYQSFIYNSSFLENIDFSLLRQYYKKASSLCQFVLYSTESVVCYTIVLDANDADVKKNVYYYKDNIGIILLKAYFNGENNVKIENIDYIIENIKINKKKYNEEKENVMSTIFEHDLLTKELPDLSSEKTLYLYNGNILCHKKHHVEMFKASIELLDNTVGFYVEYCHECNQFLMKYDDYKVYLNRFKFFPMKICHEQNYYDTYDRAETSPLLDNGYSVNQSNNLSEKDRHAILAYMMDYGIMDKRKILDYLEIFINTNGKSEKNKIALSKWLKDKEFVLNYKLSECPIVKIGKLERRNNKNNPYISK